MQNSSRRAIKVLIVDDHPVVLSGCRSLFASSNAVKIEVATDAKSGHAAYHSHTPDVMVIDIKLPDVSGFELMRRIRKDYPDARIIVFSMNDDPAFVVRAIGLGAQGYVTKGDDPRMLVKAVLKVAAGEKFISPTLAAAVTFSGADQSQSRVANNGPRVGNPTAIEPRRQDRRSRRYSWDILQNRGQQHVSAQAEARRQKPFRPNSDRP